MVQSRPDVTRGEEAQSLHFGFAPQDADPAALADFFCANLTPEYISHSEMQSARTDGHGNWAPNLGQVVRDEIAATLALPAADRTGAPDWSGVVTAHDGEALVGLAIVRYARDAAVAYGVLEDIVVDAARRGQKIGSQLVAWILADMKAAGLGRAYLESGADNHGPHALFHDLGFTTVSVVMAKAL